MPIMPMQCSIDFPRINDDEMRSIDYGVIEQVFATHIELGRLADETVYHHKLLHRLKSVGIEALIEFPIKLSFRGFSTSLSIDLVVDGRVIYELKTVASLSPATKARCLDTCS